MKTIFTFLFALIISMTSFGQSTFVHTATAGNISADASYIDHPDLNNNPAAQILVSHTWNPPGSSGVYNLNTTGVFYSSSQNRWGVYNESGLGLVEGSSYTIYIDQGSDITLHIADIANQGSTDYYTVLNHPDLNSNPDAQIILTTYFNPNGVRNDFNYGVWYNTTESRWIAYTENFDPIPLDAAFFVGVKGTATETITHAATAGNTSGNWTGIDHPLLNNNPSALFVFSHNWGVTGDPSNISLDKVLGMWYTGSQWAIYIEDQDPMPLNIEFDIMIFDPSLGVTDENNSLNLSTYPNPTKDFVTISAQQEINTITVYNILGQQVKTVSGDSNSVSINLSEFATGHYIAKVVAGNSSESVKIIKH